MTRRANGEDSVRQRANGAWEARLSFTDTSNASLARLVTIRDNRRIVRTNEHTGPAALPQLRGLFLESG